MGLLTDRETSHKQVYYPHKDRHLAIKLMRELSKNHYHNANELCQKMSDTRNAYSHKRITNCLKRMVSLGLVEKYVVFKSKSPCKCNSQRFVKLEIEYNKNQLKCRDCNTEHNLISKKISKIIQYDYSLSEQGKLFSLSLLKEDKKLVLIKKSLDREFFNLIYILIKSRYKIHAKMMLDQLKQQSKNTLNLKQITTKLTSDFNEFILTQNINQNDVELYRYKDKLLLTKIEHLPLNLFTM